MKNKKRKRELDKAAKVLEDKATKSFRPATLVRVLDVISDQFDENNLTLIEVEWIIGKLNEARDFLNFRDMLDKFFDEHGRYKPDDTKGSWSSSYQ
jgi:hypothetical protein